MTVVTNKGNFSSFKDLLTDMQNEGYDTVNILRTEHICNQIKLGGLGQINIADVKNIITEIDLEMD